MSIFLNVGDYERAAREKLSASIYDYIAGGAWDEVTLAENRTAYDHWRIRPRFMVNVEDRDLSVKMLEDTLSLPIGIAPSAFHQLMHPDGELATARAAGAAGILMCLSTMATRTLEEVASVASSPLWFQIYIFRDRGITTELMDRSYAAGYKAVVLTVDTPILGRRERDPRNKFELPAGIEMRNVTMPPPVAGEYQSPMVRFINQQIDPSLTWRDVEWLVKIAKVPIFVKGILHPKDARLAQQAGVNGIIVSNHGGRQLDGAVATLDALPDIVSAIGEANLDIIVDGGIRRGTDVVKALALGAKMVWIGRSILWGLAVDGEAGARAVLELLRKEFDVALALTGCPRAVDLNQDFVTRV